MELRESIDLDFGRYLRILKRRLVPMVVVFLLTVTLAVLATTRLKPSYKAEGKLLFKVDRTAMLAGVGEGTGEIRSVVASQNPLSTEIEVIFSIPLLQKVIKILNLKDKKGQAVEIEEIRNNLNVKIIGGTDVLNLSYASRNPEEAAAVVNTIMHLYLENYILTERAEAKAARDFLAEQLPKTEINVREIESDLRIFKERNNVVSLPEEAKSAVEILGGLEKQIQAVKAQVEEVSARTSDLRKKVGLNTQDAIAVSALSQSLGVQEFLKELQDVEKQLANQRSIFQEDSPLIITLKEREANLKVLLRNEIEEVIGSPREVPIGLLQLGDVRQTLIKDLIASEVQNLALTKQLDSLYSSQRAYQQRANILPQLEQQQKELERKLEAAQATYQNLLKKLQEAQVAENKNTANARIIEPAPIPKKPESGSKLKVVALGVLLGSLFATTIVLLLEIKKTYINNLENVKEVFGYSLLGIVPTYRNQRTYRDRLKKTTLPAIFVLDAPDSFVSEAYERMLDNLTFLGADKELKSIVVTSSVAKEGKSTVSANLAAAIAQMGRQVLLIDADMRHPSQHDIWQLPNGQGFSKVIVGKAELGTVAREVMDNLNVLTAGAIPPNPKALLDSKRTASLIKNLSNKYDFLIIDAPPLLMAVDALTLSQMTDGIVLVVRPGMVDTTSADAAKEMLERTGQNVLGLVVNGAKPNIAKTFLDRKNAY